MAKYPIKKIDDESNFASEVQTHDGELLVRFRKSGTVYRFSNTAWKKGLIEQVAALADCNTANAKREILDATNAAIEENRAGDKFVRKLRGVTVSTEPPAAPDEDGEIPGVDEAWSRLMADYEGELSDPGFKWNKQRSDRFESDMTSPFGPDFSKLDPKDALRCVKADTGIAGFDQAYFMTNHEKSNDVEKWFLAVCPIAWFGEAVADFD